MLTAQQAADHLNVSRPYVAQLVDSGRFKGVRRTQSGHRRVPLAEVERVEREMRTTRREALELPYIQSGKLRPLAVTAARRSSALPEVPTLAEAGLPGFDIGTWFGILAPAATPAAVLDRLNADMVAVIRSDDFRRPMGEIGAEPIGDSRAQMAETIRSQTVAFAKLVKDARVSID